MRSKISCFDMGIARNLARRFWPLWAVYLAAITVVFPLELTAMGVSSYAQANARVLQCAMGCVTVAIPAGAVMAMAMFSFMYSSRSVGMICSLPLRRETMYMTALLCGLVPMLLADIIAVGMAAAVVSGWAYVETGVMLEALGIIIMETVAFYGFAVFCGQLTGNILVLPLVYVLLNVSVYAVELGIRYLLSNFVYGMNGSVCRLIVLSPIIYALNIFNVSWTDAGTAKITVEGSSLVTPEQTAWSVRGLGALEAYCAAGILLAGLGLLLYKCRRMETATDAIAISFLRPVFKYCMCFGGAIVFAYLIYANFGLRHIFVGLLEAVVLFLMMSVGAAIGYFLAKMLMEKTLHVFGSGWRGLLVGIGVIALFVFTCEFDLYGYERYVPAQEDVAWVELSSNYYSPDRFCEQQNISDAITLHCRLIAAKRGYERRNYERYDGIWMTMKYHLNSGREIERAYYVLDTPADIENTDSEIWLAQRLMNSAEAIASRTSTMNVITPETIRYAYIYYLNGDSVSYGERIDLTADEAYDLYSSSIQPDLSDSRIGMQWIVPHDDYGVSISICVTRTSSLLHDDTAYDDWIDVNVSYMSTRTADWIREHYADKSALLSYAMNDSALISSREFW